MQLAAFKILICLYPGSCRSRCGFCLPEVRRNGNHQLRREGRLTTSGNLLSTPRMRRVATVVVNNPIVFSFIAVVFISALWLSQIRYSY
jgi:hypothetical protein